MPYLVLALIIFGGMFYYCIRKLYSRRFMIIESVIEDDFADYKYYIPQVKIGGIWFYILSTGICAYQNGFVKVFLDPQDALECIDKFKSAGNYNIPSNQRLKSNQKAIHVE